jgi:hypothetical protein
MEVPQDVGEALPRDVECALGTELNVLISGGDQHIRLMLARMICEANKTRRPDPLVHVRPVVDTHLPAALTSPSDRGTLLIEEVGALSPLAQVELGRLLLQIPMRVIGTTADDLLAAPNFDHDLFYRLNTIHLVLSHAPRLTARAPGS